MTDPRDHDPPPPGQEPGEEQPHGVVEQIREEIGEVVERVEQVAEEVVEHVPKPVRWTIGKIIWLAVLGLVALVVIAIVSVTLYFANRTQLVAKELTLVLNQMLASHTDVELSFRDIKGNPFVGVRILDPKVRFRHGDAPALLEAPSMTAEYDGWALATGRRARVRLILESPTVRIVRGPDGKLLLPKWEGGGGGGRGKPRVLALQFRIHQGTVILPRPQRSIERLELDGTADTGTPTRLQINDLHWASGPFDSPLQKLVAEITSGDRVELHVRELRTPDLALSASGGWPGGKAGKTSEKRFQVEIARVRWAWLAKVFDNRTFDVPGEGKASAGLAVAPDGAVTGRFRSDLDWNGLTLEAHGAGRFADDHLVLEPLESHSAAGDLRGRVEWTKRQWEVGGEVANGDPARWKAIGLEGWPEGKLAGRFRYAVLTRGAPEARLDAWLGASEIGGWRADSGRVVVSFPSSGPDSFQVTALRRGGRIVLDGASRQGGWDGVYAVDGLPLDEWPDGRASGIRGQLEHARGALSSTSAGLRVTGSLEGVSSRWQGADAGRWRIDQVDGRLLPTPDLTANARFQNLVFLGLHFDSAASAVHLGDRTLAFDHTRAWAGDTVVTTAGNARWSEQGWQVALDPTQLHSTRFDWASEGGIGISGDPRGVTIAPFTAHDRDARAEIGGRWAGPGGAYDFTARASRLDLARLGLPADLGLSGRADGTLRVWGVSGDPRWSFEAFASGPGVNGHRADSVQIVLQGAPSRLEVREGYAHLGGGTLRVTGRVESMARAWPESLNAGGVQRWIAEAGHWEGSLRAEHLGLDGLERLVPSAAPLGGTLSGTLSIAGRPGAPELELESAAQPLTWDEYRVDEIHARARYRPGRLEVPELRMTREKVISTISGNMPLRLALGARPEIPDEPMSWQVALPNGDLQILPQFVPQVGSASGHFELAARIAGTVRKPDLDGTVRVRDGMLRMAGREEVTDGVYADLTLDESRITLDTLSARQGPRGRVRAKGVIELSGMSLKDYRFTLRLRDFTAIETGAYAAVFDGDFTVNKGPRVAGQVLPLVTGEARLQRAVLLYDFANQSEAQQIAATTQPLYWTYRIQVEAPGRLRWQPPDGDIEFSANLSLEQTPDSLLIYGELHSLRGTYFFLSNRFTVQKADLTFDNLGGVDPVLDIEATTRTVVTETASQTGSTLGNTGETSNGYTTITADITGRASEPRIQFSSTPVTLDEAQILRQLTLGRFQGKGGFQVGDIQVGDPLDSYLTRALNKQLSAELSRAFQGWISDWELARDRGDFFFGTGDVIVGVGGQITDRLSWRARQRVPGLGRTGVGSALGTPLIERGLEAEYRLSRFFFVTTELSQRRANTTATGTTAGGADFNVNLKARWEY